MAGRPAGEGKISQAIIDAVISLWPDSEAELSFSAIHEGLVKKGIVQRSHYRYKTVRILKRLSAKDTSLVERAGRGRYRLKVNPEEFKPFDYLRRIRHSAKFDVGGALSKQSELYLMGMPDNAWEYTDVKYALELLNVRISEIFVALSDLSKDIKDRNNAKVKKESVRLPPIVVRELMLELFPYYLGSKAGMDFDGLTTNELNIVLQKMVNALPDEVEPQISTLKSIIQENLTTLNRVSKICMADQEDNISDQVNKRVEDFALLVMYPEFSIDESGYEQRWIKNDLKDYANDSSSELFIASSLLHFEPENVKQVFKLYGTKFFGAKKSHDLLEKYNEINAAHSLARIIDSFNYYSKHEKKNATQFINKIVSEYGIKTLISYLPFSHVSTNYILPTPRKEELLKQFFPQLDLESIHKWLEEGANIAREIAEVKLSNLAKTVNNLEDKSHINRKKQSL